MFFFKKKSNRVDKKSPDNESLADQQKRLERKDIRYYMQLFDDKTQTLIGHLADINYGGFKMDSQKPIPVNVNIRFRMDLTSEVADKPRMVFIARSRWCKVDPLDPFSYNVGFQLIRMSPQDGEIFNKLIKKYGKKQDDRKIDLRRTNIW